MDSLNRFRLAVEGRDALGNEIINRLIKNLIVVPLLVLVWFIPARFIPVNSGDYDVVDIYHPVREWVDKLETYECQDCGDHFRRLDSNGKYSYSCLQFQRETFIMYSEKYNLLNDDSNVDKLIYDCSFQKLLAVEMIKDNPKNWVHWRTSINRGLELPPTI